MLRHSARLLQGRAGRYLYTSTVAVYDWAHPRYPFGPDSATAPLSEPGSEDVSKHYGALKALCEQEVLAAFGAAATTIVRPTYVCGRGDKTQRYTWWVDRVHRGGELLALGDPQAGASIIDVRDLARFCIHLLEQQTPGTFNACGPAGVLSFSGMLESIRAITNVPVTFQWVDAAFLAARVKGREIPLWTAEQDGYHGLLLENQTSIEAGLTFTTLADTARATREWHQSLSKQQQTFTQAGLAPAREQEILDAWRRS